MHPHRGLPGVDIGPTDPVAGSEFVAGAKAGIDHRREHGPASYAVNLPRPCAPGPNGGNVTEAYLEGHKQGYIDSDG